MEPWIEILKLFGAPAAVAIFFLMRLRTQDAETRSREERMARRLDEQQDQFVSTLKTVVRECSDAQQKQAEALRDLVDEMRRRPCMSGQTWDGKERRT